MAKTLGCADVGYKCVYRITAEDDDEQFMIDTTIDHAKRHHPELTDNLPQLSQTLKEHVRNLLEMGGYKGGA